MPIVYILTNQCMPDIVKIGKTDNLDRRVRELDNTSSPLPFECFYAVEVEDATKIESKLHQGLDDCRVRKNREYFYTTPERAKSLLEIAELMGGRNVTPTEDIVETSQDKEALDKARKNRVRFNFQMLDIQPGTILQFKKDNTITCEVIDDTKVKFRDEVTSLTNCADIIIKEMGYDWTAVGGPTWWCYKGETLHNLRKELEN
jgi:hypothetical protein